MSRIAITGAGGFIGQALVRAARAAGHEVLAITRGTQGMEAGQGVTHLSCDLGASDAAETLAPALGNVDAVIHAAARMTGSAPEQARDTIDGTHNLVTALKGSSARLVLVSSLSVYDVAALRDGALLDETAPLVRNEAARDAYAATKLRQEEAAKTYDGNLLIIRPGAVYGPHRLWSAQLGFARGGRVICPDGRVPVPAIHVDHAAETIVNAAATEPASVPVNLIDPDPPTQAAWIAALQMPIVRVPRPLVLAAGRALGRGPGWAARFRPLRYDISRAETLLAHAPRRTFAEAVAEARAEGRDAP